MQDTCIKEKCRDWGDGTCPLMMETWWTPPANQPGQPVLVTDCAPKRTMLMVQELSNRLLGVEKAQEELRNETVWAETIAHVLGKNSGVDLTAFVQERQRQIELNKLISLPKGTEQ